MKTQISFLLLFQLLFSTPGFSQVVEERVTENNGLYQVCGEGDGLNPCRDVNGETYEEEMGPADVKAESNNQMAAEAARIRNESPQELEATISEMEQE